MWSETGRLTTFLPVPGLCRSWETSSLESTSEQLRRWGDSTESGQSGNNIKKKKTTQNRSTKTGCLQVYCAVVPEVWSSVQSEAGQHEDGVRQWIQDGQRSSGEPAGFLWGSTCRPALPCCLQGNWWVWERINLLPALQLFMPWSMYGNFVKSISAKETPEAWITSTL